MGLMVNVNSKTTKEQKCNELTMWVWMDSNNPKC